MKKNLTKLELEMLEALVPEGSQLWYNRHGMLEVIQPGRSLQLADMGRSHLENLRDRGLLELVERGLLVGEKYELTEAGRSLVEEMR